jgi:hypothetical protein
MALRMRRLQQLLLLTPGVTDFPYGLLRSEGQCVTNQDIVDIAIMLSHETNCVSPISCEAGQTANLPKNIWSGSEQDGRAEYGYYGTAPAHTATKSRNDTQEAEIRTGPHSSGCSHSAATIGQACFRCFEGLRSGALQSQCGARWEDFLSAVGRSRISSTHGERSLGVTYCTLGNTHAGLTRPVPP